MKPRSDVEDYMDYWMVKDSNFSNIFDGNLYYVKDVEHYNDRGSPRTVISLSQNLVILFPPYQQDFDYNMFNNKNPFYPKLW